MALITHLDEYPNDLSAQETRKLVDLALNMCRDDLYGGIVAEDDGEITSRSLTDERRGPWRLVRSARDRVWEKAGFDSNILMCPSRIDDIQFDDIEMPNISEPGSDIDAMGDNGIQFFLNSTDGDWDFLNQLPDPAVTLATPDGLLYPSTMA